MTIAIIGTRGIPNNYGGFEQCAEYLAAGLVERGFEVIVYNSHNHPFQENHWNGVKIVHCYDPEEKLGTAGQFIYDFNCIIDCRKRNFDVILQLGYTSSSVWHRFLPKKAIVTTNMDGLEWKRSKYKSPVKRFLQYAEKLAAVHSNFLISDSIGIQDYLKHKYNRESAFIPYGADLFNNPDESILQSYHLVEYSYNLLVARLEPENSIEIILDGIVLSDNQTPFLVIGNYNTSFGQYLISKFKRNKHINFLGGIYNINILNNLRYYSNIYFHGHTVGGTNPSLLEAMASNSLICANDNPFNRYILNDDAFYFKTDQDIATIVNSVTKTTNKYKNMLDNNKTKINKTYSWNIIVDQYAQHLETIIDSSKQQLLRMHK